MNDRVGRTNTLIIKTPEGVVFSLLLAGPMTRFLAWLVDLAAIAALSQLAAGLVQVLGLISRDLAGALTILAYFLISIGYGLVLEWFWRGQTLGKRLLRLRVMDVQGLRLVFSQIVIRNLLRFLDSLPALYLVGGLACLISRRGQRLGDLAANTIVVRHPRLTAPDLDQLLEDKYNSFHDYPHLEARLRQLVSPQEAGLAIQALVRRDQLEPAARILLFQEIAGHFRRVVQFPPEVVEGIPDEQYVRNVVGALFRSGQKV
ncbi:MAG: RDD family protein [Thermodesulfobacteriota bacterium]